MATSQQILAEVPKPQNAYYQGLFAHIPADCDGFTLKRLKAGSPIVAGGQQCSQVWFLLDGEVRAYKQRESGGAYGFALFEAPQVFGEMECLADVDRFKISLDTATDCLFAVMGRERYLSWMQRDASALYNRCQLILKRTMDEMEMERANLFLSVEDRLVLFLLDEYDKDATKEGLVLKASRQVIGEEIGSSVRSVNRALAHLEEAGLIRRAGGKVILTPGHYRLLLSRSDHLCQG